MTVTQLNEFSLFNKKPKPNPKAPYTFSNHTAKFSIDGFKRFDLSHKSEDEGGGYEIRVEGASQQFNDDSLTLDDAIKAISSKVSEWKKIAKAPTGSETSPADLPDITRAMFDLNKLKKELGYKRN